MKKLLLCVFLFITIFSCKKDGTIAKANATIEYAGYACGPACDAIAFSISVNGTDYFPSNLPQNFRVSKLAVVVSFKKTGKSPKQFEGPPLEIVDIINIQKR